MPPATIIIEGITRWWTRRRMKQGVKKLANVWGYLYWRAWKDEALGLESDISGLALVTMTLNNLYEDYKQV